jgi:hypothetical protein
MYEISNLIDMVCVILSFFVSLLLHSNTRIIQASIISIKYIIVEMMTTNNNNNKKIEERRREEVKNKMCVMMIETGHREEW